MSGDPVPDTALRPGPTVGEVRPDGTVRHSGGESRADLVAGADGLRSVTRRSVWPDAPVRLLPAASFVRSLAPVLDWPG